MKVIRVLVYESDSDKSMEVILRRRTTYVASKVKVWEAACYQIPTDENGSDGGAVIRILSVVKKVLALIGKPSRVQSDNIPWWNPSVAE